MAYDVDTPANARLWPYGPDWSRGFNVRRAFETDIVRSRNATEQRRSLRDKPRLSAEYTTVVSDDEKRLADHHMRAWQNRPVTIPDFARWARTTASSSSGTSTLTINPMPAWVAADQPLVLCGTTIEQVLVQSVVGTTITIVGTLAATWASGSVIRPTFFGLFDGRTRSTRLTKGTAAIDITISAYPGGEPPRDEGSAWATFNGYEVFTLQPDFVSPPSVGYLWPVEQIDYGRGRTAEFRPVERFNRDVEAEFNGLDVDGSAEIEQFFDRMKGRRGAFYMPTWEKDLILAASAGSGDSDFLAEGPELADDFADADFDDTWAIAVCLTNGTHIYRLVTGIAAGTGPEAGDSRVTVSAAWGVALSAANVARISWMPLWRMASDEMTTVWRTTLSAGVRLGMTTVAKNPLPLFVGGKVATVNQASASNLTISLTNLTGGISSQPAEGDVVLISYTIGHGSIDLQVVGYDEIADLESSDDYTLNFGVFMKLMDGTPDTSFDVARVNDGNRPSVVVVQVWRRVDPDNVLDVPAVTATGQNVGRPNPPAITPLTRGATVVCLGAAIWDTIAALTQPGTELSHFIGTTDTGLPGDVAAAAGSYSWAADEFDPIQWTGGSTSTGGSWAAVTLALRPLRGGGT